MNFNDFLENFYSVNVCMVRPPEQNRNGERQWYDTRERFMYSMINDGCDVCSLSYVLTLHEKSDYIYVSVHQKDIRCVGTSSYIDIGVTVLQFDQNTNKYILIASTGNSADRQNQTELFSLHAGQYLIIPTSTGCKLRSVSTTFMCTCIFLFHFILYSFKLLCYFSLYFTLLDCMRCFRLLVSSCPVIFIHFTTVFFFF